jgi:hypothetical protein
METLSRPPSAAGTNEADIGFLDGGAVDVREVDDSHWKVLKEFSYRGFRECFVVPAGERTDFASVPRPFVWFIPRYGRYTKAAILHDHLCRLSHEGRFHRREADAVFRQAMRTENVAFLRRWIMWAAVRLAALGSADGRKQWWRDAPIVIPITLIVLPIVLPAATLIVLTLLVWYVAEFLVWIPLLLVRHAKSKRHAQTKRVNKPELALRL